MSSTVAVLAGALLLFASPLQSQRAKVTMIVRAIQHADYAGDRAALRQLHQDLAPFIDDHEIGARVQYWRGFALWRRAFNGFNDAAPPAELEEDLTQAVADFRDALARDPSLVDAKIGAASSLVNDSFLHLKDREKARELFTESAKLLDEASASAPENPRLLWVKGANQWYAPPERGGGQMVAIATYQKGLELARRQKGSTTDPLEPTWGEPELLMNLAFAYYNLSPPDYDEAERYARGALVLVPYWHYVRDILMVQIHQAKHAAKH